jgi:hypothetical protein
MMATLVLMIAVVIAALIMASGVWVAAVLAATVVRAKRPVPAAKRQALGEADS